jgi:hypothetical protein
MVVIFPNEQGGVACLFPCDPTISLEQIAKKDVPFGTPYRIVPRNALPEEFHFFDAFEADFSTPDGYGADYGYGSTNEVIGWNEDGTPILKATV